MQASEFEVQAESIDSVLLDADSPSQRYLLRACYSGADDPDMVLELSPWIDFGDGEVRAVLETEPEFDYVLTDQRTPLAPLAIELDGATACATGVGVRLQLDKPGAGKSATVAWVAHARAFVDDPDPGEDAVLSVTLEPE